MSDENISEENKSAAAGVTSDANLELPCVGIVTSDGVVIASCNKFNGIESISNSKVVPVTDQIVLAYTGHFDSFLCGAGLKLQPDMELDEIVFNVAAKIKEVPPQSEFKALFVGFADDEGKMYLVDDKGQTVAHTTLAVGSNTDLSNVILQTLHTPSLILWHGICLAIEALKLACDPCKLDACDFDMCVIDKHGYRHLQENEIELNLNR
ncbi:uncharacterized protein LOC133847989 [Drosophila sulfurigaster albostrigata]|uniref:uncharacterized protein LOC133847989 n=1 Tax=Drosophila sulfurigaster albostrigata TaxID=89887 RepID=UPI002D21CE95|nr:uncharacterized protein LOC133847989 [Drosophila sulfurigaster albostrigata]